MTREDLVVAADHGVELAFTRQIGQVARVALKHAVFAFGLRVSYPLTTADLGQDLEDSIARQSKLGQESAGRPVAVHGKGEKQVFGGDVIVFEAIGFFVGYVDDLFDARRHVDLGLTPAAIRIGTFSCRSGALRRHACTQSLGIDV